ncbi:MAG TPA: SET domain-containing protein [Pseudolabrys sp.]|nr:SET domain-containing protein [Pseudolabrys sp.]
MLLVKTYLDKSPIHGLGVFALDDIPKGAKIWRFVEGFDRAYTLKEFARLPKQAREFLQLYGYRVDGEVLFTVDYDRHINHSDEPNTEMRGGYVIARWDIPKGTEITNDYREFDAALCAAFLKEKKSKKKKKAKQKKARRKT